MSFSHKITANFSTFLFASAAGSLLANSIVERKHHRKWEFGLTLSGQGHLTWHYFHLTYKKTKTEKKVLATQTNQIYPVPESKSMLKFVWVYGAVFSQGAFIMRFSDYSWFLSLFFASFFVFLSDRVTL